MADKIATEVNPEVHGHAGPARCYQLDPPLNGAEFVTVWVQDAFGSSGPEAVVVAAVGPSGAAASLMRLPGSYVGAEPTHSGALFLSGYRIVIPEPEPEVQETDGA